MKHSSIQRLLFTLLLAFTATAANAYSFVVDGIYYDKNSDGTTVSVTYKNTNYNTYKGSITIPSQVTYIGNTYDVTSIGDYAFYGCSSLTSVAIPNSLTIIGQYAFKGCVNLQSVTIPNSVTAIGKNVFSECRNLTAVTLSNNLTSIAENAFIGCNSLNSVAIPNSVTSIESYAFSNCDRLTAIIIPKSVSTIDSYAFANCSSLKSIVLGSGLTNIGSSAFSNCSVVKAFWLPNTPPSGSSNVSATVNYVANDQYSFSNQTKYQFLSSMFTVDGTVYVPVSPSERTCDVIDCTYSPDDKVITIAETVTNKGISLTVVTVKPYSHIGNPFIETASISHNGLIGNEAFRNCTNLQSISISNEGDVGNYAFQNCVALQSATISNGGSVGEYAFDGCSNLQELTLTNEGDVLQYAFQDCGSIENLTIANQGNIGEYAFNCGKLQNVAIANEGNVGNYAFQNCTALQTVSISNPGNIGDYAFQNCTALQTASISNPGNIGDYAFQNCTALQTASILNQGNLGNYAFSGCSSLATATLGEEVIDIGEKAFYNCLSLGAIAIPNAVTVVGPSAFEGCAALKNVYIGLGVTSLKQRLFYGCSSLTSLNIPNNVKSVGNYVFDGCTALSDITIEDAEEQESTEPEPTTLLFPDWTSTNQSNSSTSYKKYTFVVQAGSVLTFNYSVSSESGYDFLIIKLSGTQIVKESGSKSGSYRKEFTEAGTYTLYLSYTKDSSNSSGSDQATVTDIWVSDAVILTSDSFADWTSTNHSNSSTSYQEFTFVVQAGSELMFNYSVSSESGYDFLIIKLNGTQIVKESGSKSGSYRKEFTEAGTYTLYLSYTKDSSNSSGSDQATVTDIYLSVGYITDSLYLGSNGSSPLFVDCPLDEVYIGRKLSYATASSAGYSPFYRNTSLRAVEITDAETEIYDNEFYGCINLQTLRIGNGVKTIGKWAFSGCSAMQYFSVGSNVESIGQEAFSDCTDLTNFYSYSVVPPTCGDQALDDINKWECTLYVLDDCISAYQAADQWKEFFYISGNNEDVTIDGGVELCIEGGVLHCGGVRTAVYTFSGVKVYSGCGDVELAPGAYIVVANGRATKVAVK